MQITLINSKHSSDITGKSRFGTNRPTFQTEIIQNEFVKQAATSDKFVVCKSFTTYCTYRPYTVSGSSLLCGQHTTQNKSPLKPTQG